MNRIDTEEFILSRIIICINFKIDSSHNRGLKLILSSDDDIMVQMSRELSKSEIHELDQLQEYIDRMNAGLSADDFTDIMENKCKLIYHNDIERSDNLEELLGQDKCAIIFNAFDPDLKRDLDLNFDLSYTFGHWTCIFLQPETNKLYYFDPCDPNSSNIQRYIEGKLSSLLKSSTLSCDKFFYRNPDLYQSSDSKICGLWCFIRLMHKNLTDYEFNKLFYDYPTIYGIEPDLYIASLIVDKLFKITLETATEQLSKLHRLLDFFHLKRCNRIYEELKLIFNENQTDIE